MATIPKNAKLTATSVDIVNAIRNNASNDYKNYVPIATADNDSLRAIGDIIMDYPTLQNEFLHALINRIGLTLISSKLFRNPWYMFKKGILDFGETIEEIFVNIAKPFTYDPETAEKTVYKREIPDVKSAFHSLNYQKFYKTTIQNNNLKQAFLSWNGVVDLICRIVDSLYSAANYDEFLTMKYLIAQNLLNGRFYTVNISQPQPETAKSIVSTIKGVSNSLEFMSTSYNQAGVSTYTNKNDQFIIINSKFDAFMDVEVLAAAFNMDKADFMGHRILVDSFGNLDIVRLKELFSTSPEILANLNNITPEQINQLNNIPAIIVDRNWFMIFDNLNTFTENYNGEGLYWNYFYHVWKTFSSSPFSNAIAFIPGEPTIDSITITPNTANVNAGQNIQLSANVTTNNFAPKTVTWYLTTTQPSSAPSASDVINVTISNNGLVSIPSNYTAPTPIYATAVSTYDHTKYAYSTINIG